MTNQMIIILESGYLWYIKDDLYRTNDNNDGLSVIND